MSKTLFFSVGEPSGDQHAGRLIEHLRRDAPGLSLRGFGGTAMAAAGCRLDLELTNHAVVGILEVLPKIREFFGFADQAEAIFKAGEVDGVVLVDFPGFNWHIAKRAKLYGIPVYYYCPPQLWAWGGWRVKKMRRTVDHVLTVLNIEETYFRKHGLRTTHVGHPFFDAVAEAQLDSAVMAEFAEDAVNGKQLVAVLPGSRGHEVKRNWPVMLAAIRRLSQGFPAAKFLVAAYREKQRDWCREQLEAGDDSLPIEFHVGSTSEVIEVARCAMMVSGSVSLELMARGTPAAVIYRIGRFLNAYAKTVVKVDSMTLPNLMSERKVFPEMVSVGDPAPAVDFLYQSIAAMLGDDFYYHQTLRDLNRLRDAHARPGASAAASRWITEQILGGENVTAAPFRRAA